MYTQWTWHCHFLLFHFTIRGQEISHCNLSIWWCEWCITSVHSMKRQTHREYEKEEPSKMFIKVRVYSHDSLSHNSAILHARSAFVILKWTVITTAHLATVPHSTPQAAWISSLETAPQTWKQDRNRRHHEASEHIQAV